MSIRFGVAVLLMLTAEAFGQSGQTTNPPTLLNLQTQTKNPDFSSFSFTRPMTVGSSLPATCQVGQLFFNTSAAAGANVYACTAANVWTAQGATVSSPGASMTSQLGDFAITAVNRTLTVGVGCSSSVPCNVRFGNISYSFRNSATITSSGSSSGLVLIYIDSSGNLTAGANIPLTCNGCTYVAGATSFPTNSIPLYNWSVTNGTFDVSGGTDFRAFLSSKNLIAGSGITITETAGSSIISLESGAAGAVSFVGRYAYDGVNYWGPNYKVHLPVLSNFTQTLGAGDIIDASNGDIYWQTAPNSTGIKLGTLCKAAPVTPYIVDIAVDGIMLAASHNSPGFGIGWANSADKLETLMLSYNGDTAGPNENINVAHWSSTTTAADTQATLSLSPGALHGPLFFRIQDDGATRKTSYSNDGSHYIQLSTESSTNFFSADPSNVCLVNAGNTGVTTAVNFLSYQEH